MRPNAMRVTSALCLSLALIQPPASAFAKPDHCKPGVGDCKARGHGKPEPRRAEPAHHNAKPVPRAPQRQQRQQQQHAEPSHHNGPPKAAPKAAPQPAPQQRRAEPSHHNGPPKAQGRSLAPQQQQRRAEPSHHNGPPKAQAQGQALSLAPQPLSQQALRDYARHDRIGRGPNTHEYHLRQSDVPHSRDYSYRRHDTRNGGNDLAKYGLALLAGATVGALLSNQDRVVDTYGSRVVYRTPQGRYGLYHDPNVLIRRPGSTVSTERYDDGSVLTRVVQPDGTVVTTLTDPYGRILRRRFSRPGGQRYVLYDDTARPPAPVPRDLPPQSPVDVLMTDQTGPQIIRSAFEVKPLQAPGRVFSLNQVLDTPQVRYLVPEVEVGNLNFPSGSAAIPRNRADALQPLAKAMTAMIAQDPTEVFLIEGHSDTVGDPGQNLALSDARAESAALALTEYFGVPPQNLVTRGYGESDLKEQVQGPDPANRRLVVRRITDLLPAPQPQGQAQN